jgi:hypothetical protein
VPTVPRVTIIVNNTVSTKSTTLSIPPEISQNVALKNETILPTLSFGPGKLCDNAHNMILRKHVLESNHEQKCLISANQKAPPAPRVTIIVIETVFTKSTLLPDLLEVSQNVALKNETILPTVSFGPRKLCDNAHEMILRKHVLESNRKQKCSRSANQKVPPVPRVTTTVIETVYTKSTLLSNALQRSQNVAWKNETILATLSFGPGKLCDKSQEMTLRKHVLESNHQQKCSRSANQKVPTVPRVTIMTTDTVSTKSTLLSIAPKRSRNVAWKNETILVTLSFGPGKLCDNAHEMILRKHILEIGEPKRGNRTIVARLRIALEPFARKTMGQRPQPCALENVLFFCRRYSPSKTAGTCDLPLFLHASGRPLHR